LPDTLDETYERMLGNIPRACHSYALQMLTLLCGAKRPLTVSELIDGMAVELGKAPKFNLKRRLRNIDAVQQVCPGLTELDMDPKTQLATIRIAHFSVQEYLESERICSHGRAALFKLRKQDVDAQIACVCLTILLEPGLTKLQSRNEIKFKYPLAKYAAENWQYHFSNSNRNSHLENQAVQLFQNADSFNTLFLIWDAEGLFTRHRHPSTTLLGLGLIQF
jgi:hypothetical protein